MKAAVLYGREDVRIEKVDIPRLGRGDVLVRTHVALTCGTDAKVFRRGYHAKMIVPPAVFGHESAGVVEEVGPGTTGIEPGLRVVAANSAPCGDCHYCQHDMPNLCDDLIFWNGAYAEFVRIPARVVRHNLLPLTEGLSFHEAAMVEPLACVVRGVEESWIGRGQSVAVIGTGPIGLMLWCWRACAAPTSCPPAAASSGSTRRSRWARRPRSQPARARSSASCCGPRARTGAASTW
jgi:L-iditol 2-dehydrogenase